MIERYYGLKIGDEVSYIEEKKARVVELDSMDNNRVLLELDNGIKVSAVAEYCKKIKK